MHKLAIVVCLLMLAGGVAGCGDQENASGPQTRTVLVDYRHDETETSLFDYFPKKVSVRPGDTIEFKQAWTGEPHSVTFGRIVDPVLGPIINLVKRIESTGEIPKEEPKEFEAFNLPFAFDGGDEDDGDSLSQQAAQPCYVPAVDTWPGDVNTPCPRAEQPAFTGRDAIYSSGLIPYEGVGGNTFKVPIAADAEPGTYGYYCNVHGPLQYGQVEVVAKGEEIPSARFTARKAREEAESRAKVMVANHKAAKEGKPVVGGEPGAEEKFVTKGKRIIGVPNPFFHDKKIIHGIINEFVPRDDKAKVGQKVTWTFAGTHTISFNVPKYFPVFTIAENGRVEYNSKASEPAGWPGPPKPPEAEGGDHGGGEGAEGDREPPDPVKIDAGTWDGRGFRSTGLDYPDGAEFSVTFTRSGTYAFACLIHPSMVGKIVIE